MRPSDYEQEVTERFGKSLKEVMYDLCVIRKVVPTVGAHELGVPKEVFVNWRNRFKYGPKQLMYESASRKMDELRREGATQHKSINRPLEFEDEVSLLGFKELINRKNEILKKQLSESEANFNNFMTIHISTNEMILETIDEYEQGKLLKRVKELMKD